MLFKFGTHHLQQGEGTKVTITLSKKALTNPKLTNWFRPNPKRGGRTYQPKLCPAVEKTGRFKKAPISHLIDLLNIQLPITFNPNHNTQVIAAANYSSV